MATVASDIEQRLADLDIGLFEHIQSQTSQNDRRSLLAVQLATREIAGDYGYLEIGSYLGGSLQPHLVDPRCVHIYSIDKRPTMQPDSRGLSAHYRNNSTQRMLDLLAEVDRDGLAKITCYDADTRELSRDQISEPVQLCLIDGEHTDEAVKRDFAFCLDVLEPNGAIMFHDAQVVYNGLAEIVEGLKREGRDFHAYNLPDGLMVFEIGDFPLHEQDNIAAWLLDNHIGYLSSLQAVDYLRRWANVPPLRFVRRIRARFKGLSTCD